MTESELLVLLDDMLDHPRDGLKAVTLLEAMRATDWGDYDRFKKKMGRFLENPWLYNPE